MPPNTRTLKGQSYSTKRWANLAWPKGSKLSGFSTNTASTVKQTVEQVNRLQTALDYVQKVSATVRRARMFTDLIDRQNRLNSNCLRTLEEAEKMDMKGLPGITSAVQDVVANNAAIISLTGDILSSDLKMNDSE